MNFMAIPIVGGILAGWNVLKGFLFKFYSFFFVTASLNYTMGYAVAFFLQEEFCRSRFAPRNIRGMFKFVRSKRRKNLVGFDDQNEKLTIWWRKWKPLFVSDSGDKLTFIRGMFDLDTLILEACDLVNEKAIIHSADRFIVYHFYGSIGKEMFTGSSGKNESEDEKPTNDDDELGGGTYIDIKYRARPIGITREDIGQPKIKKAMSQLVFSSNISNILIELNEWMLLEDWFKERGIPWKRGYLLEGPPGTGKTAFVRALGQELNIPIVQMNISTMTNIDMGKSWNRMMSHAPCIMLIEDIDAVFDQRNNIAIEGSLYAGLTFDCLLNTIDGVDNTDGVILIITTNDISKVDPALGGGISKNTIASRPGRIDRVVPFEYMDRRGMMELAQKRFTGFPEQDWIEIMDQVTEDTIAPAQFQEICIRHTMKLMKKVLPINNEGDKE